MERASANRKRCRSSAYPQAPVQVLTTDQGLVATEAAPASFKNHRDKYQLLQIIGEGTYGVVYRALEHATGRVVALKKIRTNNPDDGLPATSLREIKLLKCLSHPNIVSLNSIFVEPQLGPRGLPLLLLEFDYHECDLRKFTKRFPKRRLPLPVVKMIMYQMAKGLAFCHERQIMHRDMKPSNVLVDFRVPDTPWDNRGLPAELQYAGHLDPTWTTDDILAVIDDGVQRSGHISDFAVGVILQCLQVKIADFGLARIYPLPVRPLTHEVVTLWYRAPEIVLGFEHYTTSIDMWSLGCIMLELLYGRPIFAGDSEMETLFKTFQLMGTPTEEEWPGLAGLPCFQAQWPRWRRRPDRFDHLRTDECIGDDAKDLLDRLLAYAPECRCTAEEMLNHPWFNDVYKTEWGA